MNRLHNEHGFTLVEALIAIVILSLGILTLISMQTTVIKGNAKARGITTASVWAQNRIEQLLNVDYDTIANDTATSPDGHYNLAWTVNNPLPTIPLTPGSNPQPYIKQIQITVSRDDFGLQRAVTFNYFRQKTD